MHSKKTVCLVVSKEAQTPGCNLFLKGQKIKQVNSFKYLGSIITSDGRCRNEIRTRIGQAKQAFWDLGNVLRNKNISFKTRQRVLKCYVLLELAYGINYHLV